MTDNIGPLTDSTVTVEATPNLRKFVSSTKQLKHLDKKLINEDVVDVSDLREIVHVIHGDERGDRLRGEELEVALIEMLRKGEKFEQTNQGPYLHELLNGASLNLPQNPVIERNPVLAARVEKLRHQQEERAYQAMTKNVSAGKFHKEDTIAFQMNMMNRQLIAVGQVILSVAAGFAFGFLGVPLAIGGMEFGMRILLGLLTAIIIAVAELYFLTKHMTYEDAIQDKKEEEVRTSHPHQD